MEIRSGDTWVWPTLPRCFFGGPVVVNQSQISKNPLDLMHAENLRGTPTWVPVLFDQRWPGKYLARWLNGGTKDMSGRSRGALDQRLYKNCLGHEDAGIGGESWEAEYGRPSLPAMHLHPIESFTPLALGKSSESELRTAKQAGVLGRATVTFESGQHGSRALARLPCHTTHGSRCAHAAWRQAMGHPTPSLA
ncbi:hypothetical protein GQ53DRAFT_763532 [Thozetella sp. PMI_491]|nr:hypothetical protein GQ53DRAFT_763532 [Thozetella sp. PMI_491]